VACKECVVIKVRLAKWVSKVFPEFLAVLDLWASKVPLVLLEQQVQSDFVVSKERLVALVCEVLQVQLVQLVQLVYEARLVHKVLKERWDLQVSKAILDLKASRVTLVQLDLVVHQALQDNQARMV